MMVLKALTGIVLLALCIAGSFHQALRMGEAHLRRQDWKAGWHFAAALAIPVIGGAVFAVIV